jgi:hypothetical protein
MIKINLDTNDINSIIKIIVCLNKEKKKQLLVFYNSREGKTLNKDKIYKLIIILEKQFKDLNYYFYNIPFCIFKNF